MIINIFVATLQLTAKFSPDELIDYASKSLVHYMVPEVFIQLEKMPMTQNGKIDKKALPKPLAQPENLKVPETQMQKKIFDIVAKIIGNDFFGIDTSFYRAGLSSISAMKLCVILSDEFGVTIKTSDIHEYSTVEKLESYIKLAPKSEPTRNEMYIHSQVHRKVYLQSVAKIQIAPFIIYHSFSSLIRKLM